MAGCTDTIYDYRNSRMAGRGYMRASVYLISFFIIGISNVSKAFLTGYHPG